MFEHSPSDRMQRVGLGELRDPARCMICGNGNCEEGYLFLGVWFEYEGNMYLCRTCLIQCAEVFGCLIPEEASELRDHANTVAEKLVITTSELEKANERLAAYDAVLASFNANANRSNGTPSDSSGSKSPSSEPLNKRVDESTASPADSGESTTEEPIKVRRSSATSKSKLVDITSADNSGPKL